MATIAGSGFADLLRSIDMGGLANGIQDIASSTTGDATCDLVPIYTGAAVRKWETSPPMLLAMLGIQETCTQLPVNDQRSYFVFGIPLGLPALGGLSKWRARTYAGE